MTTTANDFNVVGRCKGFPDVSHVNCGGDLSVDGWGTIQIPTGVGFRDGEFVIDAGKYEVYTGWCDKCGKRGLFIRVDVKPQLVTKKPKYLRLKGRGGGNSASGDARFPQTERRAE